MADDYGSTYTNAHTFPLAVNPKGLAYGSLSGTLGAENNEDEDWFKIKLLKGATYKIALKGGPEVYDLNDGKITWYKLNGTNGPSTIQYWYYDQNRNGGYLYNDGIYTTPPVTATDNYYLRVDLDKYADDLDVGKYKLSVNQLTPGFGAPEATGTTQPTPDPTKEPGTPSPTTSDPTPTKDPQAQNNGNGPGSQSNGGDGPTVINNYYTTNNNTNTSNNTSNNTNNNTNTTINNTNGTVQTGDIGSVENTNDIDNTITIENSFELKSVNINLSNAITSDGKKSAKVEGTSGDDLIADGDGRGKLKGREGADGFYFSGNEPYKKKTADQVVDFNTKEGDQIIIADQVFFNPIITNSVLKDLSNNPEVVVVNSKKDLNKASKDNNDFIYHKSKGELYIDTNGADTGFADKGSDTDPLIATLDKKEELTDDTLASLVESLEEDKASDPVMTVATNKKEFKQAQTEGVDVVYYEPKGDVYVDGNGKDKGWGNKMQGGIIADLPKNTPLSSDNIVVAE